MYDRWLHTWRSKCVVNKQTAEICKKTIPSMKLAFKVQRQWQQLQFAAVTLPPRETSSKEHQIKTEKSQASCFLALLLLLLSAVEEENELKLAHKWFREPSPWEIINKSVFTGWVVVVVAVICIYHYWTFQCGVYACVWMLMCGMVSTLCPLPLWPFLEALILFLNIVHIFICGSAVVTTYTRNRDRQLDGWTDGRTARHAFIATFIHTRKAINLKSVQQSNYDKIHTV